MRGFRNISLRAKLIAIVMITTCASLLLVAGSLAVFDVITHRRTLTEETATMAQILGDNSTAALLFDNAGDANKVLGALASQPDVVSGCLYDGRGALFASYVRAGPHAPCPAQPQPEVAGFRGESLIVYHPVLIGQEHAGTLRLVASLSRLQRRVQLSAIVLVLVLVVAALAALGLSSRLQVLVSRPILELAGTAKQISERRDYALRAPQRTEDEIGVAVHAFNQMLERIEEADRNLRALNATLEERVAERTADAEERATALKRSNEELEGFAYVASHDLQEPLRAVSSYAQLIQRQLGGAVSPEVDLYVQHVIGGANRMRELIRDLLDFSRVGRQASELVPVPVDAVLDEVLSDLAPTINEAGAQVTRGPLPHVLGDSRQLAQLLSNLITNAIRFRGDHAPVIDMRADRDGEQWRFAVHDNGIGIEPRHHERIFVMFQRLHGRERPGTGIGLAICRKIVAGHGGRIWVESQVGQGSTFLFTLPAVPGGAPAS
jgi:signal transduction histidine kinase